MSNAQSQYQNLYDSKLTTAEEAAKIVKNDSTLVVAMGAGAPPALLKAIANRIENNDLRGLSVYYKIATRHLAETLLVEDVLEKINAHSFFITNIDREIIKKQQETGNKLLSFVPCHFSQIPRVLREIIQVDTFIITVSPMDKDGYFSFGTNNDYASTAARSCGQLIVEVNPNMPTVFGQSQIHVSQVKTIIENTTPYMTSLIKVKIENNIGTIALDNYKKRNALSIELINSLLLALDDMHEKQVRVVIIRQDGFNPIWSAGHDVNELPKAKEDPLPYDDALLRLLRGIRKFDAPVIAMIHGSVWGGAFDFVMNCDMVIGDESCSFAMTPAKLGLPYNISGIQHFLSRLPINIVKELFFTADPMDAERALQFNLLNRIVSQEKLEEYTYELANKISTRSSQAISAFKEQTRLILEACPINPEIFEYIEQLRRDVYVGKDYNEGIKAFLEKRPARF